MPEILKRAFSEAEAAYYLSVSPSFLRQSRVTGPRTRRLDAPKHTKIGKRKIVYLLEDLDAWLDEQVKTTAEADVA